MSVEPCWQVVRVDELPPQPWRNGGGVTRELLVWPPAPPWQVRISVADITADGPFSAFPGVDRWFAVLQGEGVVLQFPQGNAWPPQVSLPPTEGGLGAARPWGRPEGAHSVVRGQAPLHFEGALAPGCRLRAGATRDLNLMALRRAGQAQMLPVDARGPWHSAAPLRALFTTAPLQLSADAGPALQVPAWSLAVHTAAAGQHWRVCGEGPAPAAWWLSFDPHPSPHPPDEAHP